jgi:hypothetical protein
MSTADKVRKNQLRWRTNFYGYRIIKSRSRNPHDASFGLYAVFATRTVTLINQGGISVRGVDEADLLNLPPVCTWTLDQVEAWLNAKYPLPPRRPTLRLVK